MDLVTLWTQIGAFFLGLVVLFFGAEWTVRGSSIMASRLGISPIVVGVTIVALGTSAPELVVGIVAALTGGGAEDLALGNIIGSNIANIGLIVGVAGLIYPLAVRTETLKYEVPMMILSALALFVMASSDGVISRLDGGILIGAGVLFNYVFVKKALKDSKAKAAIEAPVQKGLGQTEEARPGFPTRYLLLTLVGIALLCGGAQLMVESATKVAHEHFGISMIVIGLTIVAVGTSLPELAASVMAALKKQSDIALGNVLGSNIYNILLIIGVVALITPLKVSEPTVNFDLPVMLLFSVVFVIFLTTDRELVRWESTVLLLGYVAFLVMLYLRERGYSFTLWFM